MSSWQVAETYFKLDRVSRAVMEAIAHSNLSPFWQSIQQRPLTVPSA